MATCSPTLDSRTLNSGYDSNSARSLTAPQVLSAVLPAGNWFVAVEPSSTTQVVSDYTIAINQKPTTDEVEPNDTAATATVLPLGNIGKASRATTADNALDWWKVAIPAAGNYFIQTRPWIATDSTFDTQIWICNENTALNTSTCTYSAAPTGTFNDDTGPWLYSEWTYAAAAAGNYYIGVQAYNQGTSVGNYLLTVDRQ